MCKYCDSNETTLFKYTLDTGSIPDVRGSIMVHNLDGKLLLTSKFDVSNIFHDEFFVELNYCPFCGKEFIEYKIEDAHDCDVCGQYLPDRDLDMDDKYYLNHIIDLGILGKINAIVYNWVKKKDNLNDDYEPSMNIAAFHVAEDGEDSWETGTRIPIKYCCKCGREIKIENTYN